MSTTEHIFEILGGRRIFGTADRDPRKWVRRGLPFGAISALASQIGVEKKELIGILDIPARTLARRRNEKRFRAGESDRLFRVGRIVVLTEEVLGTKEKAAGWLRRANRALGGETPLSYLDTDHGAQQIEDLLIRIAHGVFS